MASSWLTSRVGYLNISNRYSSEKNCTNDHLICILHQKLKSIKSLNKKNKFKYSCIFSQLVTFFHDISL